MSIIYEALNKVQKTRTQSLPTEESLKEKDFNSHAKLERSLWMKPSILALMVVLIGFLTYAIVSHFKKNPIVISKVAAMSDNKPESKPESNAALELNGVFTSDANKMAMINNQLLSVGSSINDMKIVEIDQNSVTLKSATRTVVLRTKV